MKDIKEVALRLALRWLVNTAGLWVAVQLLGTVDYGEDIRVLIISGLLLSIVNAVLKPLLIVLSLPFIVLSLGLFTVVINGVMVWLVSILIGPLSVEGFSGAVLAGIIIGLVNYVLTIMMDRE